MKSLITKLIICISAFFIGLACFDLWTARQANPQPQVMRSAQRTALEPVVVETGARRSDSMHRPPQGSISKVDFRNFTYPRLSERGHIRIRDGGLEFEDGGCLQRYSLQGVDYLDLTGDNKDEAIVHLIDSVSCGSSWTAVYYYVYTMRSSRLRLLWSFATGSEAHGGEKEFRIEGTELVFELYGKWRAVGGELEFREDRPFPDEISPTHYTIYRVRWNGSRFGGKSVEVLPFTGKSIY